MAIIFFLFYSFESFSHQRSLMVFYWTLSDCKFPQIFRMLLTILVDLNNSVIWMVSTRPLISKYPSPNKNALSTVPSVSIVNSIKLTFMFHCFLFLLFSKVYVFIVVFAFLQFCYVISHILRIVFSVRDTPFVRMFKFKLLAQFLVDHLHYSVVSRFIFSYLSLIMWLIVSSPLPHNLHLLLVISFLFLL